MLDKNVTVPSIFFIGKTGTPLDIITESHTIDDFLSKLTKILHSNGINVVGKICYTI